MTILFDSSAPGVNAPIAPPGFVRHPWWNLGVKPEPSLLSAPQGAAVLPGGFLLADHEPAQAYDPEPFARSAVTAVVRYPSSQVILYGACPITAAQADPGAKATEDHHLARLDVLYKNLARLNVWLALDLSFGPKQDVAGWKIATPKRLERLWMIRSEYRVIPVLILGVRRGGGGAYADTVLHTDQELVLMADAAKQTGATIGVFTHCPDQAFADQAAHSYAVISGVLAGGLKPKPVPTVVPGAGDAKGVQA